MSGAGSDRLDKAKAIPIMEVAEKLHICGLKRAGFEHVGPCPVCGGSKRFNINSNKDIFICRTCARGGDQIALVEFVQACDFKVALNFLVGDQEIEVSPEILAYRAAERKKKKAKSDEESVISRQRAINAARSIWDRASPATGTLVEEYLRLRGLGEIGAFPPTLRFISNHPYFVHSKAGRRELYRGPCMIAAIQTDKGRTNAIHQTWLDLDQPKGKAVFVDGDKSLPSKKCLGSKKGGSIRLSKIIDPLILVMGEGIETTLTALQSGAVPGAMYWCGVDLGNMAGRQLSPDRKRNSGIPDMADLRAFVPPAGIKELIFIQDGDSAAKPTRAKLMAGLRRAINLRPGLVAKIVHAGDGVDLNDLINSKGDLPNG